MMGFVNRPYAGDRGQHEAIEHRPRGRQQAGYAVRRVRVLAATFGETVRTGERCTDFESRRCRDRAAKHGLQRLSPHLARAQHAAVVFDECRFGTDDAEAAKAVAERQWYDLLNQRIGAQCGDRRQRNIARWHIDVIHAREHELQRTALGADDEIDARGIAREPILEFA